MVMESLSGVRGENSVKIVGPDLAGLERLSDKVAKVLGDVPGISNVGVYHIMGQSNLTFPIDRHVCRVERGRGRCPGRPGDRGGWQAFQPDDRGGAELRHHPPLAQVAALRRDAILKIPVEVAANNVTPHARPGVGSTNLTGGGQRPVATGISTTLPSMAGNVGNAAMNDLTRTPRRRLEDFVSPRDAKAGPRSKASS